MLLDNFSVKSTWYIPPKIPAAVQASTISANS